MHFPKILFWTCAVLLLLVVNVDAMAFDDSIDFNRDIRPLLSDRCYQCHGPDADHREADLRFDQTVGDESPLADRDGSPAIKPGAPDKSSLWLRIVSTDEDEVMPPPSANKPKFSKKELSLIRKWIEQGARYDTHWAFKSLTKQTLPTTIDSVWEAGRIDRFVMDSLKAKGLKPKQRANRRTLIRRLSFDLTGLPPTSEEINKFLNDKSDSAYENLVDQLLQRSSYGEHMARYWLDLVRFADTNGIHHDHSREITPYRDWVIRSFNQNRPFDQFIQDQLAGDLIENRTTDQLIASGFNRLHLVIDRGTALPEESFHRNVVDRVSAFGTVFMGLTVQCAQCHEHKYDPITQQEFYELYAFFNNIDATPETPGRNAHPPFIQLPSREQIAARQKIEARIQELQDKTELISKKLKSLEQEEKKGKSGRPDNPKTNENKTNKADSLPSISSTDKGEKTKLDRGIEKEKRELTAKLKAAQTLLKSARNQLNSMNRDIPTTLVMKERDQVRETRLRIRGAYDQLGDVVQRNTPDFLPPLESRGDVPSRLDLARWLTNRNHPLTARVAVNRFWQQLFGSGLVKTSEDFGAQGQAPSHPKLLDDLSIRFIESGWDVKKLIKEIVMSETYQQSSIASREEFEKDKENRLLARGARFRLDAETIRDQILLVSGQLNRQMYGRSVKPPQPPNLWKSVSMKSSNTYSFQADAGNKIVRRSVYSFWKRAMPPPQMTIFDAPTRESCIARRERTNTPLQALVLMNETQYFLAAKKWSQSILRKFDNDTERISELYQSLTSEVPDKKELAMLLAGLEELRSEYVSQPELAAEICDGLNISSQQKQIETAAYTTLINSMFSLDIVKTRN